MGRADGTWVGVAELVAADVVPQAAAKWLAAWFAGQLAGAVGLAYATATGCCLASRCLLEEPDEPLTGRPRAYRERFPPRPDEPRYCSTCSLRDLSGCEERPLFRLAQERAAHPGPAGDLPARPYCC